jgi:DNA replication licensing factor MCM7
MDATLAAFVDFIQNFKSSSTDAADQLENLNLNGDNDEYDMLDDSDDPAPNRNQRRTRTKAKYVEMLQDIADRTRSNVLIDLNDLETVRTNRVAGRSKN